MNQETHKKLIKDFPKSVVKPAPKGKFGDYVPHHIYTQRLVDVIPGGYDFTYEVVRAKDNSIIGAECKLYIKSTEQTIEEVGDVDMNAVKRNITESEILKLAVSDGIKRCCMRLGIGLELWTGGTTEEEHYADNTEARKTSESATKSIKAKEDVVSPPVSTSSDSPVDTLKEANFTADKSKMMHPNGSIAMDDLGLWCPCGSKSQVKFYTTEEKSKPRSPDFRCQAMGQCTAGDTVDGKVFAKSWWMDSKDTPKCWQDWAAAKNGIKLPNMAEIPEGDLPF